VDGSASAWEADEAASRLRLPCAGNGSNRGRDYAGARVNDDPTVCSAARRLQPTTNAFVETFGCRRRADGAACCTSPVRWSAVGEQAGDGLPAREAVRVAVARGYRWADRRQ